MIEYTSRNIRGWARLGQRGTIFGALMPEAARSRPDLRVITADMGQLFGLDKFKVQHPDKFINVGIAEQNMIGIASGMAREGFRNVFATTYASFISMRCFEQVRHNLGYQRLPVKLIAGSAGLSMGMSGSTHYAVEDLALMRSIPNMLVLSPADATEAAKMFEFLLDYDGPAYLRLSGDLSSPVVYKGDYHFEMGRGIVHREGADAALIATGTMLDSALRAAEILSGEDISCAVVDMHTIKPLDTELIDKLAETSRLIVTAEEHSLIGGLGSAVAEHLAGRGGAPRLVRIALPDEFGKAGEYKYLMEKFGLTAEVIAERVREQKHP